ncbi:unnamed protein product [Bursaphelenchus okinawaensis]|uniref:AP-3 complex subunit beta n=1 Tax=Bursaphelenchus okinawaensis TaxID=465554 RepID=A0A811JU07_9BILA|nr:unnamed protein product [Bursaphelenchus okinawaensis]CAG9082424.1 unnamed protein product [Bursaphelenchus okinawaensis]
MRLSYPDGLTPDIEIAEGGTMLENKTKFADLKVMLDNNKESVKIEAMKRIINMVAKGKDVSELFPAVVKNVAVKHLELKKLVYVYLVRYAEEQQDLALLSISTFQRALKDPNQLIRASALRVLSSIRVQMIAPVMLLAIKDSVRDMSAYVRKVAAHAIPKLYSLDPDLQEQLVECIDFLLGDKRTLVLGSAVHAFEQICPDRLDLLHKHYRSLCQALVDVDEWGQVVMIGLLSRYARTQFTKPEEDARLDPDYEFLLLSVRSLLQSRNCAVVMAVAQLYFYTAPKSQLPVIPRALIRLLRGPNEVQYVVLVNIATICAVRDDDDQSVFGAIKSMFEPFLKSFFIQSSDTRLVKQLKLQILTCLVTETNVQMVVRELQAYLHMADLAGLAIEAIGRCALKVNSAESNCLSLLVNMISSQKENIVCSAVVVLKRLLHTEAPESLLKRVVKLIPSIKNSAAKACVVWLVCTHIDKLSVLAPDVLRVIAKNFCEESDEVKLQALNLSVRLWAKDRQRCELLVKYVLQLARYDRSYDIRDRCRFIRNCIFRNSVFPIECFLQDKPTPSMQSQFGDREQYQLGTLSHLLNQKCVEYCDLPEFPEVAPDPTIRRSARPLPSELNNHNNMREDSEEEESELSDEEEEGDDNEEAEESAEEEEEEEDEEEEDEDEEAEDEEEEEESSEEEEELVNVKEAEPVKVSNKKPIIKKASNDLDLLLDLNFETSIHTSQYSRASSVQPQDFVVALDPLFSNGLGVKTCFNRVLSVNSSCMVNCVWKVCFQTDEKKTVDVRFVFNQTASQGVKSSGDVNIFGLSTGDEKTISVGIDFDDCCRKAVWTVDVEGKTYDVNVTPTPLDLVEAIDIRSDQYQLEEKRLSGLHETVKSLGSGFDPNVTKILSLVATKQVEGIPLSFASQTVTKKAIVLFSFYKGTEWKLNVKCENSTFCSIFAHALCEKLGEKR